MGLAEVIGESLTLANYHQSECLRILSELNLKLNPDCKNDKEVSEKFSSEYMRKRAAYQNENKMEWTKVKALKMPVYDKGQYFTTTDNVIIDWGSQDRFIAQNYLLEQSKKQESKMPITMELLEVLRRCSIDGNTVRLPDTQLSREDYITVKNKLELIGGKWKGGKVGGFIFQEDPTDLLAQITNGEQRNIKKEFQFFGTPSDIADRLVGLANPSEDDKILEPSAGQGAIVKSINRYCDPMEVCCYELMPLNQTFLGKISTVTLLGEDFLKCNPSDQYDIIIANPPFSKNQDILHIRHMYACLKKEGRLVSMCSPHYIHSSGKKETEFKQWLTELGADVQEVEAGAFKESGTNIKTLIIIINKAA